MKSNELRQIFLDFFKVKDHAIVPSTSLIPRDDPSLLFIIAGMVQFKPLWTGAIPLPYSRATSVQKCLRTSDLDNVGKTRRHLTFFEMLGNFSFGDYFKEDAIVWAWEFLLDILHIDETKLAVSVFKDDDEAFNIWHKKIGLPPEKVFRLGEESNFWGPAGNTGPCGPCSEIFYDLGEEYGCGKTACGPGCDCDRFPEIWNLVFPQFNQIKSGKREPLKNRGVDTGMGFERLLAVVQKKNSFFQTDLFYPIIEDIIANRNLSYGKDKAKDIELNVIADHIRALTFAIGDGIIPSNEERGYVLRRILRRAVRLCRNLGFNKAFLFKLVPRVTDIYKKAYPELVQRREEITLVVKSEEERFLFTMEKGLQQFEEISKTRNSITGEEAFKLYDTYGFPIELTREIALEKGITVDDKGFINNLEKAREHSKAKAKFIPKGEWTILSDENGAFIGYDKTEIETDVIKYNTYEKIIEIVLKESPFYAEAGGQIGDKGEILGDGYKLTVQDTYWYQGMIVCHCTLAQGKFSPGKVTAKVAMSNRKESARAHTATHLLHAALREILGEHARQEGSFVEPGRFRFDFIHFNPLSDDEIQAIEDLVNEKILDNIPVEKLNTTLEKAKKIGAMAIFGEKYGTDVRVVSIDDFSIELCGGIHLDNTGEIGLFKILSQEAAAAGIRRIEAIVGLRLFEEIRKNEATIKEISNLVGGKNVDLVNWVSDSLQKFKETEKSYQETLAELARSEAMVLLAKLWEEKNTFIAKELKNYGGQGMRLVADMIRAKTKKVMGIFYEQKKEKIYYLIFVGDELVNTLPANKLIGEVSKILGGGGGGRTHMAEGGGGDPKKIFQAIDFLKNKIK
ncbi:MAG: alanine--tRNA ligase [bacterium]